MKTLVAPDHDGQLRPTPDGHVIAAVNTCACWTWERVFMPMISDGSMAQTTADFESFVVAGIAYHVAEKAREAGSDGPAIINSATAAVEAHLAQAEWLPESMLPPFTWKPPTE